MGRLAGTCREGVGGANQLSRETPQARDLRTVGSVKDGAENEDWWHTPAWSGWTLSSLLSPVSSGLLSLPPSAQDLKGQHWGSAYQDKWREQVGAGRNQGQQAQV